MSPAEFIAIWQNTTLNEEQGAQSWFNDLCDLIGFPKPLGELDGLSGVEYSDEVGSRERLHRALLGGYAGMGGLRR